MKAAKKSFPPKSTDRVFIHADRAHQTKLSYFLVALTLHHVMVRSIIWPLSIGSRQKERLSATDA
jgi:hypothetical protein